MDVTAQEIIEFWFKEIDPSFCWKKDQSFDQLITDRYLECHIAASSGELSRWRKTPEGRLAEIIVLDQFSRNIFRDTAASFASDSQALALAQVAVDMGDDLKLHPQQRSFLYLPYMHSESLIVHEQAVQLFNQPGLENNYNFELKHKDIIERFGRYPHRNEILNRTSTPDEIVFLAEPGSSF